MYLKVNYNVYLFKYKYLPFCKLQIQIQFKYINYLNAFKYNYKLVQTYLYLNYFVIYDKWIN